MFRDRLDQFGNGGRADRLYIFCIKFEHRCLLDVELPKDQSRTDWSQRPLDAQQRRYADIQPCIDAQLCQPGAEAQCP